MIHFVAIKKLLTNSEVDVTLATRENKHSGLRPVRHSALTTLT